MKILRAIVAGLALTVWLALIPPAAHAQGDPATPPPPTPPTLDQNPLAPELESALPPDQAWLNTDRPLRLAHELKGHVVLLDFWTHCCINCMHILPDLAYLEEKYADQPFVVVGVHSAKFDSEGDRASIRDAMLRHNIRHPVLIDTGMALWRRFGVRAWPTFVLIGSDGRLIGFTSGEGKRDLLDEAVQFALDRGREGGTLAPARVEIIADQMPRPATGLRYPGKVLAVAPDPALGHGGYVFVADSSNHRVVAAHWPDADGRSSLFGVYGSGQPGLLDAWGDQAMFNDPQGLAFDSTRGAAGTLYVADTKNHAIRAIDLSTGHAMTLVGTGQQSADRRGGGQGRAQGLSSPWDLALTPDGRTLYVAMAGPHQLWSVDLEDRARAVAIAGGIGENLIDGPASDAMLAQPSGLALSGDGQRLYFADSEASAVRLLDLTTRRVGTIIGRGLFEFGDLDGAYPDARLQHCIGLTLYPTPEGERLLVADTYNDKIKVVHPFARTAQTFVAAPGVEASPDLRLNEPAGLSYASGEFGSMLLIADTNNHRVLMVHQAGGARELIFDSLLPPPSPGERPAEIEALSARGTPATIALREGGESVLNLDATLPLGASVNAEAPVTVRVWRLPRGNERMTPRVITQATLPGSLPASVTIPAAEVRDGALWLVELSMSWCEHGQDATCRPGEALWRVDVVGGTDSTATLAAPFQ